MQSPNWQLHFTIATVTEMQHTSFFCTLSCTVFGKMRGFESGLLSRPAPQDFRVIDKPRRFDPDRSIAHQGAVINAAVGLEPFPITM